MRHLSSPLRNLVCLALCAALVVGCGEDVVEDPSDSGAPDIDLVDSGDDTDADPGDTDPEVPDVDDADTPDDTDPVIPDVDTDPGPDTPDTPDADPEPTEILLESIAPARGPVAGGTPFVLRGEGFDEDTL